MNSNYDTAKNFKSLDILALIAVIGGFLIIVLNWSNIVSEIPFHFDGRGNPNDWGPKWILFFLAFLNVGIYTLLTIAPRFKDYFNYPVQKTEENENRLYAISVLLLQWLKVEICWLFTIIIFISINMAQKKPTLEITFVVPVFLVILFITLGYYFYLSNKNK